MEQHHEPVDSASELLHVARGRPRSSWRSSRALFDGPEATAAWGPTAEDSTAAPGAMSIRGGTEKRGRGADDQAQTARDDRRATGGLRDLRGLPRHPVLAARPGA